MHNATAQVYWSLLFLFYMRLVGSSDPKWLAKVCSAPELIAALHDHHIDTGHKSCSREQ